jgi:glycogen operon protein
MRSFGMLLDGRAQTSGVLRPGSEITLLLCLNAHSDVVSFTLPPFVGGTRWFCLIDTNEPDRGDVRAFATGDAYVLTARSVLLFAGIIAGEPGRAVRRIALDLTRADSFAG